MEAIRVTVTASDTLAYARKLKAAGIPEMQAEAQATALVDVLKESVSELATRTDVSDVKADVNALKADVNAVQVDVNNVRQEIHVLEVTLKQEIRNVELALKQEMTRLEATFTTLEAKFGNLEERTKGRFRLLQWMLGFNLALTVAVLWLLIRQ